MKPLWNRGSERWKDRRTAWGAVWSVRGGEQPSQLNAYRGAVGSFYHTGGCEMSWCACPKQCRVRVGMCRGVLNGVLWCPGSTPCGACSVRVRGVQLLCCIVWCLGGIGCRVLCNYMCTMDVTCARVSLLLSLTFKDQWIPSMNHSSYTSSCALRSSA